MNISIGDLVRLDPPEALGGPPPRFGVVIESREKAFGKALCKILPLKKGKTPYFWAIESTLTKVNS